MPALLRVGYAAPANAACAAPGATTPPNLARLARHLVGRLQLAIQLCPFADPAAGATAIARGEVDLTNITPSAWPIAKGRGRPILTLRPDGRLPRTPIYAIARTSVGQLDAAALAGRRLVAIRRDALAYEAARAAVVTHGGAALAGTATPVAGSFAAALAALGTRKADAALVPADHWTAGCLAEKQLCIPYHVVWQARPQAASAWVLRGGLPDELRYRLIGIYLAMRLENPSAYAGASGGVAGTFEPTEAGALDGGGR